MRLLLDQNESDLGLHDIITFSEICNIPVWETEDSVNGIPHGITVHIFHNNKDFDDLEGQYNLDGTEETYKKAVKNYNKIIDQLLVYGYARMSDFENFTWYGI